MVLVLMALVLMMARIALVLQETLFVGQLSRILWKLSVCVRTLLLALLDRIAFFRLGA
jgi:hypothetical protein